MKRDYTYEMALALLPGVGCQTQRQLIEITGSAQALFEMPKSELNNLFGKHKEIVDAIVNRSVFGDVEKEMRFVEKNRINVYWFKEEDYPQRLNRAGCNDCPTLLYGLGNADLNAQRAASVVGTRKATPQGVELTYQLTNGLRSEAVTIISGLALGIDTAAHQGALAAGLPTIAVLAHGLNRIYPPQNRTLAKQILGAGGTLLTEMRSDTKMSPGLFPARNRIIAALSDGTVVVEASRTGGALITANLANGYHREVFAFPGRVGDKYSEGCNAIIASNKAMLIRGADDLLFHLGWQRHQRETGRQTTLLPKLEPDEQAVYNLLQSHPECTIDTLRELCDIPMPRLATALLALELKDCCRCLPGKVYKAL